MGKGEDELDPAAEGDNAGPRCPQCRPIGKIVRLRCVAALVLGLAMLLSAVFWMPPFFRNGYRARGDTDLGFGVDIVASFRLQRPVALLKANIEQLQYDIFEEIGVLNSSVVIVSLEPLYGLDSTNVEFTLRPYPRNSTISSAGLSILRSSFMYLVINQSTLNLSPSLFGNPYFFQVLKFPGGITIIPPQNAFLLQKPQTFFNFTLNFPIDKVQGKIIELKEQMKLGLLLNSRENLYVKLTNLNGSTIAPPIVVQTTIVLAVGNVQQSIPRLKQLAQTITSSSQGNLGLNHTVFGRVKQIRLSSYLQHSLSSGGSRIISLPPSPAPQPHMPHHNHHHHHHHHHPHHNHHHSDVYVAHAPAPQYPYQAPVPSGHRYKNMVPVSGPVAYSRQSSAPLREDAPVPAPHWSSYAPLREDAPVPAPHWSSSSPLPARPLREDAPVPAPHWSSSSPLPAMAFDHARPPGSSETDSSPPYSEPSISPSPFSFSVVDLPSVYWVPLAQVMHLLLLL